MRGLGACGFRGLLAAGPRLSLAYIGSSRINMIRHPYKKDPKRDPNSENYPFDCLTCLSSILGEPKVNLLGYIGFRVGSRLHTLLLRCALEWT